MCESRVFPGFDWYASVAVSLSCAALSRGPGSSVELEVTDAESMGSVLNGSQQPDDGHPEIDKRLYLIK